MVNAVPYSLGGFYIRFVVMKSFASLRMTLLSCTEQNAVIPKWSSINGMVKTIPYGFGNFQILHKRKQTQHEGCVCFPISLFYLKLPL